MEPDFSGYVTKYGIRCTDGRTIQPGAFKHQDGLKVPLIYQHQHNDASQVLGYTILSAKDDGIWGDSYLNKNVKAQEVREAVLHGDLDKYSIWAKDLEERIFGNDVLVHDGVIQETSVVLSGANSGASIANILAHSDLNDEIMVIVGGELSHADSPNQNQPDADKPQTDPNPADAPPQQPDEPIQGDTTIADVLNTLSEDQQAAVNAYFDVVVQEAVTEALTEEPQLTHSDSSQKGSTMSRNPFDRSDKGPVATQTQELKHSDVANVIKLAKGNAADGGVGVSSLRDFVRQPQTQKELLHADDYGIQNIEILFPDAQALMARPTFIDRRQEWVKVFLAGTSHSPFSRVKTMYADITADEARARGYIKANQKVEEVFPVFKRTTGPAMIYKKQKLDRQDIIDIVDFDVVAWMKAEMRGKLDEEIARAGLFGDGRPVMVNGEMNPDKIAEPQGTSGDGIRSVVNDDDLYAFTHNVALAENATSWAPLIDAGVEAGEFYLGSGNITAFVSYRTATKLLTERDTYGNRRFRNLQEVAGEMDVARIVRVPTELFPEDVLAIALDLSDYNFGTNRGGEVTLFDDFDIDFNQYKYLIETYLSGALTVPYSAIIFRRVNPAGTMVEDVTRPPVQDNVITIPNATGVNYRRTDTNALVVGGAEITLNDTNLKTLTIEAVPADGFYFETNADVKDTFRYTYRAPSGS